MKKEDILAKSRQENQGRPDERELVAKGKAARVSMLVGAVICFVLYIVCGIVLNRKDVSYAAWMIYSAMLGSNDLALYKHLKDAQHLVTGILYLAAAVMTLFLFIVSVI